MKRVLKSILVVALAAFSTGAFAQQIQSLPLDPAVRHGVLDNGLTYYIRHNEEPQGLVNFYIAQKVGSVQEEDSQRGLAHFLEHMCFNGSENFSEDGALINYCESIGVKFGQNLNAYTSTDETVYNIDDVPVTDSNVDKCLLILHDWADGLLLLPSEIDKERGVIHEEWRMRSSASQRILERALPELYPDSRYGYRMPIGIMEVVDNFPPETLRNYYETWYRPNLQGIVIVGDIDVDQIEAKVKAIFGPIQMPAEPKEYVDYPVPANEHAIYVLEKDPEQQMGQIVLLFKDEPMPREMNGTAYYFMNNYATSIISSVINARLNELSQNADCPFIAAGVTYGKYLVSKTMNALEVDIIPKDGQAEAATKAVMKEIERARRHGLTGTEVYRAKEEFLSQIERTYDNRAKLKTSYYVNKYVRNFLDGNAVPGIETEYQLYQALAPQVTAEVLNQSLAMLTQSVDQNFIVLTMFPEKEGVALPTEEGLKKAIAEARSESVEAYVDNVKDEPLIATLPAKGKIKKVTSDKFGFTKLALKNGANVYYKKTDFSDTEILFSATSLGGSSIVSDADYLDAAVIGNVINAQGIGNFTSTELEKALAGKQVSCSVSVNTLTEGLSGSSTPKDLETLFQLIYLRFQAPADDPDAYNNLISQLRASLANSEKMPTSALQDSITTTIYGDNPRAINLHLADLDKLSYENIKRLYSERFSCGGDFDFYFVGNFDEEILKSYVEQYIAPLKAAKKREKYDSNNAIYPEERGEVENRFTRSMETPQAYIVQVYSGVDPYSVKEDEIITALGNILTKRYLKSIREDGGLSYSVQTAASTDFGDRDSYLFQTVCPFTPSECDLVLSLMDKEIDDIAANGVTEAELDEVRKYEDKNYTDYQRNNSYWLSKMRSYVSWGVDDWTGRKEAINSVTSDEIKNFVKDVLKKQNNKMTVIMLPEDMTE